MLFVYIQGFGQSSGNWMPEKIPAVLETDFALSALPAHLCDTATVYLLDPMKGYYIAHQGTYGFSTFVNRTECELLQYRMDSGELLKLVGTTLFLLPAR